MFNFWIYLVLTLFANENGQCRVVSDAMYNYLAENSTPFSPVLQNFLKVKRIRILCHFRLKVFDRLWHIFQESLAMPGGGMTSSHTTTGLLMNLLRITRGRRVLDIGTFGGFSAIAMATVLPADGKVVTIDVTNQFWNMTGRKYAHQGSARILLVSAKASACSQEPQQPLNNMYGSNTSDDLINQRLQLMKEFSCNSSANLIQLEQNDTFDLCYVDADKFNYKVYFEQCYKLVRPLGLMAFDNVLWSGYVANNDPRIRNNLLVDNFRKFNKKLAQDPRVWSQLIAVGDGLAIVVKKP